MNSPYNVVGVFCDDIREEVNSRHTLIGIYPDNLYVPAVPGMLDRLSLYVRAHIVPALEVRELSMALEIPGEGRTVISSFEQDEVMLDLRYILNVFVYLCIQNCLEFPVCRDAQ